MQAAELFEISEKLLRLAEDFNNFKWRQCQLEIAQLKVSEVRYLEASAKNLESLVALSDSLSVLIGDLSSLAASLQESYRETLI